MKMPNMCPFEKNEKEVFFRLTFFFQEKKILSKEQLLFSFLCITRIYGHLRWPFFSPFGYGKLLELVSICNSLNNLEGITIFGRNDTNMEGMTIIRNEWQWSGRNDSNTEGITIFGRNDTNMEGLTIIRKEWQWSGRNDSNTDGMTVIRKEWH